MAIPSSVFYKFWEQIHESDVKRINSQTPTPGIAEITDIPYIDDGKQAHLLDIYYPENNDKKLPLIIDIHGGGWMHGYKEINKYYNYYLASKDFIVISVNYTLCPECTVADQVVDIFSSLKWIEENGEKYNCDMKNVFIAGDSAGGHLGAITCALMSRPDLRSIYGVEKPSFDFSAAGFVCGAFDVDLIMKLEPAKNYAKIMMGDDYKTSRFRSSISMSEILLCDTELPPIWMVSSKEDFIGFLSDKFHKTLIKNGKFHVYKKVEKSPDHPLPHVFCVTNPEYRESMSVNDGMTSFFKKFTV